MEYTLIGERDVEYNWMREHMLEGNGRRLLDFGPQPRGDTCRDAVVLGWDVTGLGIEAVSYKHAHFRYFQEDVLKVRGLGDFDCILNISTVEHVGLAGRYGNTVAVEDGDLLAMHRLRKWMKWDGRMIMTAPVGLDAVIGHWHRVYGRERLPYLLDGFRVVKEAFWAKKDRDDERYVPCTREFALDTPPRWGPPNYYAIGCWVLGRDML